eukprot:TRINITY_DN1378_c0_g1_i1.p1 TRINITY_DN1378_c0_g1~~TRINITY_DN1378_c0_g1_i1.p1  ORF type:complete len:395 (+),score=112.90 TRINITY_DN1378_c0_g1_i1:48-1232(+)
MSRRQRGDSQVNSEQQAKRARSGLAVGDAIPELVLETDESTADNKKTVNLKEEADKSGLVIFFYPKASTSGCTKQACGFRDNYNDFMNKGYQVFGMSSDKPRAQTNWKNKQDLPFTLLCDTSFEAMKMFGIMKGPKSIKRSHAIIEKGGIISSIEIGVAPQKSVDLVVEKILGDVEEEEAANDEQEQVDEKQQAKMDVDIPDVEADKTEAKVDKPEVGADKTEVEADKTDQPDKTEAEADKMDVQAEVAPTNPAAQEQGAETAAEDKVVEVDQQMVEQPAEAEDKVVEVDQQKVEQPVEAEDKVMEVDQQPFEQPVEVQQEAEESKGGNEQQGGEEVKEVKEQNGIQGVDDDATKVLGKENVVVEEVPEQAQPEINVQEKGANVGNEDVKSTEP